MAPRPRLTLLDYGHRAIVTSESTDNDWNLMRSGSPDCLHTACAAASVYGLWAIWKIHNANIAGGAEYMRVLKIEQDRARAEGREPPERLDKPASYYSNKDLFSSEAFESE